MINKVINKTYLLFVLYKKFQCYCVIILYSLLNTLFVFSIIQIVHIVFVMYNIVFTFLTICKTYK